MTPTDYARKLVRDTAHLRPTDPDTVTYVKATCSLGTLHLELSTGATYGSFNGYGARGSDVPSIEAHDFLWDVCEVLPAVDVAARVRRAMLVTAADQVAVTRIGGLAGCDR